MKRAPRQQRVPFQRAYALILVSAALTVSCGKQPVRVRVAELQPMKFSLENLRALAPNAILPSDTPLCPPAGTSDPGQNIGGLSSREVNKFPTSPHIDKMYSRLVYELQVCTDLTLSSNDRKRFEQVLNFLGIKNARSFAATLSLTGDDNGSIKYPQISPFSYAYDEGKSTYDVATIGRGVLPWQVTNSYTVQFGYNSNKSTSINTANLFKGIVTAVAGGGGATDLLSPAANAYLSAGQLILDNLSTSVFKAINTANDTYKFDIVQNLDRSITYRFRDLSNKPLAAVRVALGFTNSIANAPIVDPLTEDSTHVPHFTDLQEILNRSIGGPSGGQTLLQAISKEAAFQNILKSTAETNAASFRDSCDQLERALQTTYGLNVYDTALTMGQVLAQQNTLYLNSRKYYDSGCFRNRPVLNTMGIKLFETRPPT